jgi:predicted ATPase
LLERLTAEPHLRLRFFCSPHHQESALYPVITHLNQAAGFQREDTVAVRLDKLEALLSQGRSDLAEALPLIAELLTIPMDGRCKPLELTPQQRKQHTLATLVAQVEGLAADQPVMMLFEDAHWSDPTSLELMDLLVDRVPTLPVLVVVTFRPEFASSWVGRPHVTSLGLSRLLPRHCIAVIAGITDGKALPKEVADQITERSDGVPLFIEELTKAVLESGALVDVGDRYMVTRPLQSVAIPTTLEGSLLARLDRLASARETAQIGAALGRRFSHDLIAAVAAMPPQQVEDSLTRLEIAELLYRRGTPPDAEYTFKHALVQNAAYGSLLRSKRQKIHARIAATLETQFPEIAIAEPEALAHHFTQAGMTDAAIEWWSKAGHRSLKRSALVEAAEQFTRALDQIATLPATPALRREQIRLQIALITPLMHVKGYAASETRAAAEQALLFIEEAEALGERPDDPLALFSVLYGLWAANYMAFKGNVLRELSTEFLALAKKQRATAPLVIGHRLMGTSLLSTGDMVQGRAHYNQAFALFDPTEHHALATRFGQDVGVTILSYRSLALWMLGYPDGSRTDAERALKDARAIGLFPTLMYALYHVSWVLMLHGDYETVSKLLQELQALSEQKGASFWKMTEAAVRGYLLTLIGKASDAIPILTSVTAQADSTGTTVSRPKLLSYLAKAYADVGRLNEAWQCINEATTAIETTNERWWESEVHRIAGEIVLPSPQPDWTKVEAHFERALAVARRQQAKSWELRAATSMARLWRDQGKPQQARDLLAPVYGWFTEGFDTRDLKEARALLDELAG